MNSSQRRKLRSTLLQIDGRCFYCRQDLRGKPWATVDHFMPTSKGGADVPENIVLACYRCNRNKADQMPQDVACDPVTGHVLRWSERLRIVGS